MIATETPLELASKHVHIGEQRIAEQTRCIAELSLDGHDTKNAEEALAALEQRLTVMREHLAAEERMHGGARCALTRASKLGCLMLVRQWQRRSM